MSSYGPQGGPYPGQPQDPWQDGSAGDPYHSGYPDPLTGSSVVGEPYSPRPNHTPNSVSGEVWGPPQAPARQGRSATAIGVIIVVVLLAIGGATAAAVFLTRGDDTGKKGANSPNPSSSAPSSPASPTSTANADAKVAQVGDCLVNKGSAKDPDMQKVTCAAGTYQVLKRLNGTADYKQCDGTPNLTDWYYFDHPSENSQDFVLCLKKR
jgi:hypothetical protein